LGGCIRCRSPRAEAARRGIGGTPSLITRPQREWIDEGGGGEGIGGHAPLTGWRCIGGSPVDKGK